ncbi:MAG: peroxiredoxin family protein [Bacteroidota bacterium]
MELKSFNYQKYKKMDMTGFNKILLISKSIGITGLLCMAFLTLSSCQDNDPEPAGNIGGGAPQMDDTGDMDATPTGLDFSLTSLAGSTVKLSDNKGKVVVLFFLGYSCPYCISSAPDIETEIKKAYESKVDFAIFGLDQWDGNNAALQSFKNNTGVSFPLLLKASSVASKFKTTYDRLLVIDKEGKVVYQSNQSAGASINDVKKKLSELL